MDPGLKLLVFAAILALGAGVVWWRLVTLILRGGISMRLPARIDPTGVPQGSQSRVPQRGGHPSKPVA